MEIDFAHLHHAYLLVGEQAEAEAWLHQIFEQAGQSLKGSPDFFVIKDESFGVDLARSLAMNAVRKAFGEKKVFFIAPETMTLEAQNALLKTFEEPAPGTHFFLALRDDGIIIPTLRSRVQTIFLRGKGGERADAEKFWKLTLKERLAFVKKFVDAEKNVSTFLDDLLMLLKREKAPLTAQEQVYNMRLVSDQRGASARMILEHLALVL